MWQAAHSCVKALGTLRGMARPLSAWALGSACRASMHSAAAMGAGRMGVSFFMVLRFKA
ncbi:hypothetical protein D3C87_1835210 [compost metagenome]